MPYEFDDAENMVLGRVARWARILAWVMMVSAGLMVVGSFFAAGAVAVRAIMLSPIYLVIGLNFRGASTSMKSVIETEGTDITHLMEALEKLASALKVMGVLFLLGVLGFAGSLLLLGTLDLG